MTDDSPRDRDHDIRKYEVLYEHATMAYERAHTSWTTADEKAAKVATVLALLLAASAFGLEAVASALRRHDVLDVLFLIAVVVLAGSGITAVWHVLEAMMLRDLQIPPANEELVKHFDANNYRDVLYSMARRYNLAASVVSDRAQEKFDAVATAMRRLKVGIVALVAVVILHLLVAARIPNG